MSISAIQPVIITRDAAATIEKTLRSLETFDEVLVYDNGSTDETLAICAQFPNVRVEAGAFLGFGPTKQHAADLATGDWILSVDADEYLSGELLAALERADLSNEDVAYQMLRANLFMGKRIDHGGWGGDWLTRLFHRGACRFDDAPVHEKLVVPAGVEVRRLAGPLWHTACTDIDEFLHKISRYSELNRTKHHRVHSPANIWLRSRWAFFRSYVLKGGWRDGWRGLVIANCMAQGTFFRHMKRYVDARVRAESESTSSAAPTARRD